MAMIDSKNALESTVAEFESEFGMRCEKQAGNFSYACLNQERGIIARTDVWKSLADCREVPSRFANDVKTLLNRR